MHLILFKGAAKLLIGTVDSYEDAINSGIYVVGAAKYPFHKEAVGYSGRSCPCENPEYLYAERDNLLACNLIDANCKEYIPFELISKILHTIDSKLNSGRDVFVCCNKGESRSPAIALMYMRAAGIEPFDNIDFLRAESEFAKIYPMYKPNNGIRNFVMTYWDDLREAIT